MVLDEINPPQKLPQQRQQAVVLHPLLLNWYIQHHKTIFDLESMMSWDLKNLPSFWSLPDMEKSVDRIIAAISNHQSIGIYGDYDVDGTTSCALLFKFFSLINIPVKVYQPHRLKEGYGLHESAIDQAVLDGVSVLITVDCGISNVESAQYAFEKSIDLIITDHHQDAREMMPNAFAIINPNRRDAPVSPTQALAGVGVAFALAVCIREKLLKTATPPFTQIPSLYPLLQLVAIGSIADLATLNPMNLILIRHGLLQLQKTASTPISECFSIGLHELLKDKEYSSQYLDADIIGFYIGPLINSKGRLDHAQAAFELLTTTDPTIARDKYFMLLHSNKERKEIQEKVYQEAKKNFEQELLEIPDRQAVIVYQPHWHEGVIGIVASKLVDEFQMPALVFTFSKELNLIKASARTYGNLHLFEKLQNCASFFKKFGGHKAAAGLSMEEKNLPAFKNFFNELLSQEKISQDDTNFLYCNFSDITMDLVNDLYRLGPYGQTHSAPIFRIKNILLTHYTLLKGNHVKWTFQAKDLPHHKLHGISFFYRDKKNVLDPEHAMNMQNDLPLMVDASLKINTFNKKNFLQLHVHKLFLVRNTLIT